MSMQNDVLNKYGIESRVHTVAIAEFSNYNAKNRLRIKYGGLQERFKNTDVEIYTQNKEKASHVRKEMEDLMDVMTEKYKLSRTTFWYIASFLEAIDGEC